MLGETFRPCTFGGSAIRQHLRFVTLLITAHAKRVYLDSRQATRHTWRWVGGAGKGVSVRLNVRTVTPQFNVNMSVASLIVVAMAKLHLATKFRKRRRFFEYVICELSQAGGGLHTV